MKVCIAGAGIGGLATALSLDAAGFHDVTIAEAVPEICPLGVGINVLPHAMRELDELGLLPQLVESGLDVKQTVYYDQHGNHITSVPRGRAAGYRWPQLSVHRGVLQMLLLDAVQTRLDREIVQTGTAVRGFQPTEGGVAALFQSGSSPQRSQQFDLLVGADGIKSTIRSLLYPHEGDPEWNHCLMYRGVARIDHEFLHAKTVLFAGHHDQRFMLYPIKDTDGSVIFNWGCTIAVDGPLTEHSNWNRRVDPARLLELYSGWRFGSIDVCEIVQAAPDVYEYPMTDRSPLPRWSFERVTLLGDAAHPMYPSGSNGTSQAILDARTLAQELAGRADVAKALRVYEERRLPATAEVIRANRQMADMRVMQVVHERAPKGFDDISDVISPAEISELMTSYQRTAGFESDAVNRRESLSITPGDARR